MNIFVNKYIPFSKTTVNGIIEFYKKYPDKIFLDYSKSESKDFMFDMTDIYIYLYHIEDEGLEKDLKDNLRGWSDSDCYDLEDFSGGNTSKTLEFLEKLLKLYEDFRNLG